MESERIINNVISSSSNNLDILYECIQQKQFNILKLICILYKQVLENNIKFQDIFKLSQNNDTVALENYIKTKNINTKKVLLYCNWCSSKDLCNLWNKMSKDNYTWNNIEVVFEEPADYYCVINAPPNGTNIDLSKCIYFQMEPNMDKHPEKWGDYWSKPKKEDLLYCGTPDLHFSNTEWHLSKTYNELMSEKISKNEKICNIMSTVLSDKYSDLGHQRRVDFVKFLEKKGMEVDVFGGNRFLWKNYKGSLPSHKKDDALFPYKYTFNCENHSNKNYCTEKLYDGILAECLVFYSGCYNIRDVIDERAFVYLELSNFEKDYELIKKAINDNWWQFRLPYIKAMKKKILNEMQFFPRIEKIISEI